MQGQLYITENEPRYVRCFQNSNIIVVFTGNYKYFRENNNYCCFNITQQLYNNCHCEYENFGAEIKFSDLTEKYQKLILSEYKRLWELS